MAIYGIQVSFFTEFDTHDPNCCISTPIGARRLSGLRKILSEKLSRRCDRRSESIRSAQRGGAGFPTGLKWSFMPRTLPRCQICGVQHRRGRTGHV